MADNRAPNVSSLEPDQQRIIEELYNLVNDLRNEIGNLKTRVKTLEDS